VTKAQVQINFVAYVLQLSICKSPVTHELLPTVESTILLLNPCSNKPRPPGSSLSCLLPTLDAICSVGFLIFSLNCKCTSKLQVQRNSPKLCQILTIFLLSLLDLHLSSWSWLSSSTEASHWCHLHRNSSTRLATLTACLHSSCKTVRGAGSL